MFGYTLMTAMQVFGVVVVNIVDSVNLQGV